MKFTQRQWDRIVGIGKVPEELMESAGGGVRDEETRMFVICAACDGEHDKDEVEVLDIEEGGMGEDILTFRCLESGTVQKSRIFGER